MTGAEMQVDNAGSLLYWLASGVALMLLSNYEFSGFAKNSSVHKKKQSDGHLFSRDLW